MVTWVPVAFLLAHSSLTSDISKVFPFAYFHIKNKWTLREPFAFHGGFPWRVQAVFLQNRERHLCDIYVYQHRVNSAIQVLPLWVLANRVTLAHILQNSTSFWIHEFIPIKIKNEEYYECHWCEALKKGRFIEVLCFLIVFFTYLFSFSFFCVLL